MRMIYLLKGREMIVRQMFIVEMLNVTPIQSLVGERGHRVGGREGENGVTIREAGRRKRGEVERKEWKEKEGLVE